MRWKGIIVFAVLLILIVGFWWLYSDSIVKNAIESVGSSINGAKVEINKLDFSLLKLSVHISGLQVADPADEWKNQLEVGDMRFKMGLLPLLYGKVIIDEMAAEGIRQDTKRTTSGKLPEVAEEPPAPPEEPGLLDDLSASISQEAEDMPVTKALSGKEKLDFSQIFTPERLNALAEIANLDLELDKRISETKTTFNNLDIALRLDEIKKKVDDIDVKEKNPLKWPKELKKAKDAKKDIDKLNDELKMLNETLKNNFEFVKKVPEHIRELEDKDYQAIINNIGQIQGLEKSGISKFLFGPKCLEQAKNWMYWVKKISKMMPKKSEQKKAKRLKGEDIPFAMRKQYPGLLIKKISITVEDNEMANEVKYQGTVNDICSDPIFYGKPTLLAIKGAKSDFSLSGTFDHTTKTAHDSIIVNANQDLKGFKLGKSPLLPQKISQGNARVKIDIVYEEDIARISIKITPKELAFASEDIPEGELAAVISDAIVSATDMEINATISINKGSLDLKINSNIDNTIADAVKSLIDKKLEGIKFQVKQQISELTEQSKTKLLDKAQAAKTELETLLATKQTEAKELSKTLEDKIKVWEK